jgi:hypothetical protein
MGAFLRRKADSKLPRASFILRQLNTDGSNDDGGGGGNSSDDRRTNRTMAHHSSHSTDTVGNNHRGKTHSSRDSRNSLPGIQPQFRPKPERQNAAPERKPIHLPPMLLREPFSSSLFYLPIIRREVRQKASRSSSGRDPMPTWVSPPPHQSQGVATHGTNSQLLIHQRHLHIRICLMC